jgi:hypothetical protein
MKWPEVGRVTDEQLDQAAFDAGYEIHVHHAQQIVLRWRKSRAGERVRQRRLDSTAQAIRRVKAGLRHAASGTYQDYPPGLLELGVVLDALGMIETALAQEGVTDG